MFIRNKDNEVINLDHVLYFRVYGDRAPYEIHIFVDDHRLVLQYETEQHLDEAKNKLLKYLRQSYPRWIEIGKPEMYTRADKVKCVLRWQNRIKIIFEDYELIVYPCEDQSSADQLANIIESLSEFMYDKTALIDL